MSELTPCNYCSLRIIKRHAEQKDLSVTTKTEKDGWTNVYVHPAGVVQFPDKEDGEPSEYFAASMMKITDHCVC